MTKQGIKGTGHFGGERREGGRKVKKAGSVGNEGCCDGGKNGEVPGHSFVITHMCGGQTFFQLCLRAF